MNRIPMLLAAVLLASACGQKGDLYLPEDEREVISRVPVGTSLATPGGAATPAGAEEENDDDGTATPPAADPPGATQ
ncbi:MAG: lipoprotein [Pseudomonadota bacterium]